MEKTLMFSRTFLQVQILLKCGLLYGVLERF